MKPVTSRRALLGATAAALAGGTVINAAAIIAAKAEIGLKINPISDPILAAIERHRAALLRFLAATRAVGRTMHRDAKHRKVKANYDTAFDACERASADLIEIVPTTLAGAAALLDYIVIVATGRVVLDDDPRGRFRSGIWCLPESPSPDDGLSLYPFEVMANAHQAMIELKVIA